MASWSNYGEKSTPETCGNISDVNDGAEKQLMDAVSELKTLTTVLSKVGDRLSEKLGRDSACVRSATSQLKTASEATSVVHSAVMKHIPKVSKVPHLVAAYEKIKQEERREMGVTAIKQTPLGKLKSYMASARKSKQPTYGVIKVPTARRSSPRTLRQSTISGNEDATGGIELPSPENGTMYTKKEAIAILLPYEGSELSSRVTAMLSAGMCPVSRTTIYRSLDMVRPRMSVRDIIRLFPKPMNGSIYSKQEIIDILLPHDGKALSSRVDALLSTKYMPVKSRSTVYDSLKKARSMGGRVEKEFGLYGANPIGSILDCSIKSEDHAIARGGSNIELEDVQRALQDMKQEKLLAGEKFDDDCDVAVMTAKHYLIAIGMRRGGYRITDKKPNPKTEARIVAENSLRSAFTFVLVVASTSFIVGEKPPKHWEAFDESMLSPGATKLYNMVKAAYGGVPVYPVHPSLTFTTDDTTVFVWEGVGDSHSWRWRLAQDYDQSGARSDYRHTNGAGSSGGLRVRLTKTFNGAGYMAPPFIAVSGLTEVELPTATCESGVLVLPIPGLCKGGSTDVFADGVGFVVLLRAHKDAKVGESIAKRKFQEYHERVLWPFVNKIRERLGWEGGEIPDWMFAVAWFDGDLAQLQAVAEEAEEAYNTRKMAFNKHAAAATGTQQFADLMCVFKLIKHYSKNTTAKGEPSIGLNAVVDTIFNYHKIKGEINLERSKLSALTDFIKTFPDIIDRACTRSKIIPGFKEGGIIDEGSSFCPDWNKMMGTCHRWKKLNIVEKQTIEGSFTGGFETCSSRGKLTETELDELRIRDDVNLKGEIVRRPDGDSVVWRQRSQCFNSPYQNDKRRDILKRQESEKRLNEGADRQHVLNILSSNEEHRRLLLRSIGKEATNGRRLLVGVLVEAFAKFKAADLKNWIIARRYETWTIDTKVAWPNMWPPRSKKIEDVKKCTEENECLISLAYRLRCEPIILQPSVQVVPQPVVQCTPRLQATVSGAVSELARHVYETPSSILSDESWRRQVSASQVGVEAANEITAEMMKQADDLLPMMLGRFSRFKSKRMMQEPLLRRHDHWTMKFARDNLPRMAAQMCLNGQVKPHLECEGETSCLLLPPHIGNKFSVAAAALADKEGCYLHWDPYHCWWIRSGKAGGQEATFGKRNRTHLKNSKTAESVANKFYRLYPSNENQKACTEKWGYFENLVQYCGIAFDRTMDTASLISSDAGIYIWSKETLDGLAKSKVSGTLKEKQLLLVAYLWEFSFDLMLDWDVNVSEGAGWEPFLGRAGNKRKGTPMDQQTKTARM